jgi:hypothetical protein
MVHADLLSDTPIPWAANCTIRPLCANPCGVLWARSNCRSCSFSAELNTSFPRCVDIETSKHFLLRLSLLELATARCHYLWRRAIGKLGFSLQIRIPRRVA